MLGLSRNSFQLGITINSSRILVPSLIGKIESIQEYVQSPRAVFGLPGRVVSAFAGCNYSLAAALEGGIYEWGVYL